jgi:hypothetical protein
MQPISAFHEAFQSEGRPRARGRWIWRLIGAVTAGLLAVGSVVAVAQDRAGGFRPPVVSMTPPRTVSIAGTVTSVSVASSGAAIEVRYGKVSHVTVTEEALVAPPSRPPAVTDTVSRGRLTLSAPYCDSHDCSVQFTVTVPAGVAVTASSDGGPITVRGTGNANLDSGGGPITASAVAGWLVASSGSGPISVSGAAEANLESGGGPVSARGIRGSLNVMTDGGPLRVSGVASLLTADTGGGGVTADGVAAKTVQVNTEGGPASFAFARPPESVQVSTDGNGAVLLLPGGPYAVTRDAWDGPASVSVPTSPTASRIVTVNTLGGGLRIGPVAEAGEPLFLATVANPAAS